MKIIDANGSAITPEILRAALKDVAPSVELTVRMHPSQVVMLENLSMSVSTTDVVIAQRWADKGFKTFKSTCAGRPLIEDAWMPEDRIRFEHEGVPVIGIVNLAVPVLA